MAKSFWVKPLSWRPFWISFATSSAREACFNSSLSWSNLAVLRVVTACLLEAAPSVIKVSCKCTILMLIHCCNYTLGDGFDSNPLTASLIDSLVWLGWSPSDFFGDDDGLPITHSCEKNRYYKVMKPRASVGKNGCVQLTFQIEIFFRVNNKRKWGNWELAYNVLTQCGSS